MKKKWILVSVGVAAADQLVKAIVRRYPLGEAIYTLDGVIQITHSVNSGAAFSLLAGHTGLLAVLSVALLAALGIAAARYMQLTDAAQAALCLMIGGGAGNLIDRIVFFGVTDYIRLLLFEFPIFNLADIAITSAVAVLMLLLITGRFERITGERHGSDH